MTQLAISIHSVEDQCRFIDRFRSVAIYVNKAVSTLVMIIYEQDYRGTALSMEATKMLID